MKEILVYEGIEYPKYFYDPVTEELFGPRGKMKMQTTGFGYAITGLNGKQKYISAKKLRRHYRSEEVTNQKKQETLFDKQSLDSDNEESVNASQNNPMANEEVIKVLVDSAPKYSASSYIARYQHDIPKKTSREEFLQERGLNQSMIWNVDVVTLVRAQKLLDSCDSDLFESIEKRAIYMIEQQNLSYDILSEVMTQVAASLILAKEQAKKIEYLEKYNNLSIEEVKRLACSYYNEDLGMFLLDEWATQLRERFYSHIMYSHKAVLLRGYTEMRLPLNTLEQVQSAFKLLTNLFGWENK